MTTSLPILAQPLAPDALWFVLLLLATLVSMPHLGGLRGRVAGREHGRHALHGIGHRLHDLISHRHH